MEGFLNDFRGMLNSVTLKLTDEDAEKVSAYCEENDLLISKFKRDKADLPNRYVVWGTKQQLQRFKEYF